MILRDRQISKIYAAERELKVETEWMARASGIAFGQSLFRKTPFGPVEMPKIQVGPTGNRFGAIAAPEKSQWRITVSGTSLYKMVFTHEAAHLLSYRHAEELGNNIELHGPLFAGTHLWMVKRHLGTDWAQRLARAYGENGVKVLVI